MQLVWGPVTEYWVDGSYNYSGNYTGISPVRSMYMIRFNSPTMSSAKSYPGYNLSMERLYSGFGYENRMVLIAK